MGRKRRRERERGKNQIQCRKLQELSKCKVMLEERGKKERRGRRKEGGGWREEGGGRRKEGGKVHSTILFPKLTVEGKGVWPRLVRWNNVTPGR